MRNFFNEKYLLETKNLCKNFKGQKANYNININVREKSIYGLLGPNGAGKSTLLKMITGMSTPTSGKIVFDGHYMERKDIAYIGSLIENAPLYDNLTAKENLKVKALMLGVPDSRINEVLEIVDLKNTGSKRAGKFSMGMKQRLGIAMALLNNPKLLILDEPTNGLDPIGINELRDIIRSFPSQGITVIVSSHILSEVEQMADNIGIIVNGKLSYQAELGQQEDLEDLFMEIVKNERIA